MGEQTKRSSSLVLLLCFALFLLVVSNVADAISGCGGSCNTLDDCDGQLICIGGRCKDDPDVGTHTCGSSPNTPSPTDGCNPSGTLVCGSTSYKTYTCSPPVTSSTPALLTLNSFEEGGSGGAESECDGNFHSNNDAIVALSTGWYNHGSLCFRNVRITASNGRSVLAKVVDECDSLHGCDKEHDFQPPCRNNIIQ